MKMPAGELGANLQGGMGTVRVEYTNEALNRERSPVILSPWSSPQWPLRCGSFPGPAWAQARAGGSRCS
ncbi:MAG: hypothetical protein WKG07_13425 [Hymenobacter sp.]